MQVLFLDESGAARGPMSEAILRQLAPDHDAFSASWAPSHVRTDVRRVLEEAGYRGDRLRAQAISAVPLEEIDIVIAFVPDEGRLRVRPTTRRITWGLPDPLAAPEDERMDALRATRDEVERRVKLLLKELG